MPPKRTSSNHDSQADAKKAKTDGHGSYGWKQLNDDLVAGSYIGNYGANNGVYQAVAEAQMGKDLNAVHCLRHPEEHMVKELVALFENPRVQVNFLTST